MTELPAQRSHSAVVKTHTGLHILWAIRENINNNDNDNKGKPGEERSWYLRFFFSSCASMSFSQQPSTTLSADRGMDKSMT